MGSKLRDNVAVSNQSGKPLTNNNIIGSGIFSKRHAANFVIALKNVEKFTSLIAIATPEIAFCVTCIFMCDIV